MSFNRYYQDELSFVQELGADFSKKYPALAPFLAASSADPDVERLLEGFAFLTGRIRQKLDDEFPEIVNNLLSILCPQFLRPVPCASILQFEPLQNRITESRVVPARVSVQSDPVGAVTCSFRTCSDVQIHPVTLTEASLDPERLRLALRFKAFQGVALSQLKIDRLRLYLSGEFAFDLYRWISQSVRRCDLLSGSGMRGIGSALPNPIPAGFGPDEALVPFPSNAIQGYRLLQEYLMFPEKFLFIEFRGLKSLANAPSSEFQIVCEFKEEVPRSWRLSHENFKLYCVPAVNLFEDESNPVDVTHERQEFPLSPSTMDAEVYSVIDAKAWVTGTAQPRLYEPFLSLEQNPQVTYYSIQTRSGIDERNRNTYLSFVKRRADSFPPPRETAVFSMLCTNGAAANPLGVGDIHRATDTSPDYARFHNISRVSTYVPVSMTPERPWQLLSHLVLSPTTLNNVTALRSVVRLYNCPENVDARVSRANTRRIDGIKKLQGVAENFVITSELDPEHQFKGRYGLPIRGTGVHLTVDGGNFGGEGDLYLFGAVLNRFFSQYTTLNSLAHLRLTDTTTGLEYTWLPRLGEQIGF